MMSKILVRHIWNVYNEEEKGKVKRKFYSALYVVVFALMLSGCSLSGIADGSKSAVNGNLASDGGTTVSEQVTSAETTITEEITETQSDISSESLEITEDTTVSDSGGAADASIEGKAASNMELADIPAYSGSAYCEINGNVPAFDDDELVTDAFENYSDLDSLGRCGVAYANICKEIMPTEERGVIGMVKPSGWHTVKYNDRIDGNYLYNRCHLIGYQLAGENANEKNLITGTRYLNVTGMLPFENEVADYVESTGNHVLYRVTPVYDGDNLVASGVQMEAESVEDKGAGVSFNVYVYNVQPGVLIDYATGGSEADPGYVVPGKNTSSEISGEDGDQAAEAGTSEETQNTESNADDTSEAQTEAANEDTYIVNTNTGKFHKPSCRSVKQMKESNKSERTTTRDELISEGYEPCKNCNP